MAWAASTFRTVHCSNRTTRVVVAILTARPGKKAASPVTGTTVAPGVPVVTGATAATAVIGALEAGAAIVEIAAAEVRGNETVGPDTTAETVQISATNVAVHAPTGTTVPGTNAANVVHGDLPVAMMGAGDGRARRVDARTGS